MMKGPVDPTAGDRGGKRGSSRRVPKTVRGIVIGHFRVRRPLAQNQTFTLFSALALQVVVQFML